MTTKLDLAQFERSQARGMEFDALLAECKRQREQIKVLRETLQSLYDAFPDCEGGEQGKACKQARQVLKGE